MKYHHYIIHYVYPSSASLYDCPSGTVPEKKLCSTLLSVTPVCSGDPGLWSRHRIRCLTWYLQKNARDSMLNRRRMFSSPLQFYIY
jgi:hypothetical protein